MAVALTTIFWFSFGWAARLDVFPFIRPVWLVGLPLGLLVMMLAMRAPQGGATEHKAGWQFLSLFAALALSRVAVHGGPELRALIGGIFSGVMAVLLWYVLPGLIADVREFLGY